MLAGSDSCLQDRTLGRPIAKEEFSDITLPPLVAGFARRRGLAHGRGVLPGGDAGASRRVGTEAENGSGICMLICRARH